MDFFFNDTATTEIYTLSLHDALPISVVVQGKADVGSTVQLYLTRGGTGEYGPLTTPLARSEEHTSELQSLTNLVCRLLLEKKKNRSHNHLNYH